MKSSLSLSSNALKIIAVITMTLDHIGLLLLPEYGILRILGRIAFPIFAFMIAEGCRHTHNKLKYFLTVFLTGLTCQIAYTLYAQDLYLNILITFSFSILLIYFFQFIKEIYFDITKSFIIKLLGGFAFLITVFLVYVFNKFVHVDYGFWGCMLPVLASLFYLPTTCKITSNSETDGIRISIIMLALGMLILTLDLGLYQVWSFLALPFLFLYSGKRGNLKLKYFFYIYFPAHLLILQILDIIL